MSELQRLKNKDAELKALLHELEDALAFDFDGPTFAAEDHRQKPRRSGQGARLSKLEALLGEALSEKAEPSIVAQCLVHELYPRTKYGIDLPKQTFLQDLCACIKAGGVPCGLSIYRAMYRIGREERFVPPPQQIADAIFAEESILQDLLARTKNTL